MRLLLVLLLLIFNGSFDRTDLCELVGLYLLDILRIEFGHNKIGLYRDDGLSCFQNLSGPEYERKTLQDLQKAWVKYHRRM